MINLLNAVVSGSISATITDEDAVIGYVDSQNVQYFDILYKRYSEKVYAKCISILKNTTEAEDAMQDIFMKVMLKIANFKGDAKFSTWLYSITYNFCIDLTRRRKKVRTVEVEDMGNLSHIDEDEIEDKVILETKISQLEVIMDELNASDKAVLMMKYLDGMPIREMSTILDKTESAIKMKLKRAKERFVKIHNDRYLKSA